VDPFALAEVRRTIAIWCNSDLHCISSSAHGNLSKTVFLIAEPVQAAKRINTKERSPFGVSKMDVLA
jgi:hypothetical protein